MVLLVTLHMGLVATLHIGLAATALGRSLLEKRALRGVGIVEAAIVRCALGAGPARRLERPRDTLCGMWLNQQ
jgi:hypothetical protein